MQLFTVVTFTDINKNGDMLSSGGVQHSDPKGLLLN